MTQEEDKIRDLLLGEPKEKLLALVFMKDWELGKTCDFLNVCLKSRKWGELSSCVIVLSLFSWKIVPREYWKSWSDIFQYSKLPWAMSAKSDRCGFLDEHQLRTGLFYVTTTRLFAIKTSGIPEPFTIDLFKSVT